jgi:cyclic pyranopterin phosphate synthase
MNDFTHIDQAGNPAMVDISEKKISLRKAIARSIVALPAEVVKNLNGNDIITTKGSVFQTAIVAGIMAAKRTSDLIPLCHPLGLDNCKIDIHIDQKDLIIDCTATTIGKTGVEMEALTGATIAALTVYDMCKALSHDIVIKEIKLMEKTGGKNDFKRT